MRSRGGGYEAVLADVVRLVEVARGAAARSVNAVMTATYWAIGRRIVEEEQRGAARAGYGEQLVVNLVTRPPGSLRPRIRSRQPLPDAGVLPRLPRDGPDRIWTISWRRARGESPDGVWTIFDAAGWRRSPRGSRSRGRTTFVCSRCATRRRARFYETEALRGGWTIRQLDRQIGTQFYERTALSRNKAAMLAQGQATARPATSSTPEEEIKDPYVLEFLGPEGRVLRVRARGGAHREARDFLLELGGDFTFVGRQRRLRVGDAWYRVDLLFFHRRLRCLVIIDLKLGKFTHADAGQMHLYLNYAREHWTPPGENPPVGLILCAQKDAPSRTTRSRGCRTKCSPPNIGRRCPRSTSSSTRSSERRNRLRRGLRQRPLEEGTAERPCVAARIAGKTKKGATASVRRAGRILGFESSSRREVVRPTPEHHLEWVQGSPAAARRIAGSNLWSVRGGAPGFGAPLSDPVTTLRR